MPLSRIIILTSIAMIAFAGNSLLCRTALKFTTIDAASFTTLRLISGAFTLWLIVQSRKATAQDKGNALSALALFVYAAGFSFAYINLSTATGALLLFGAVQITMISYGIWKGERLRFIQITGMMLAVSGLVALLMPGLTSPPLFPSILMLAAGMAWGIYSIRGKGKGDAIKVTAYNFLMTLPVTLLLSLVMWNQQSLDSTGILLAIVSGSIASGIGYAIWYKVLPALRSTTAATLQLSVPVIAALGGIIFLGESLTLRFTLSSIAILGGLALVIIRFKQPVKVVKSHP